jgi:PST family polysaccharide transporter
MVGIAKIKNVQLLKSDVVKNFVALALVQITNFIIPLITFPYLVRVIGLEKFGVISYGLTVLTYLIALVDYGFNLSATRHVALNRDDPTKLSQLFSKVMTTKLTLLLVSTVMMVVFCSTIERFQHESMAYLIGMLYVLGNTLMPVWFFQGLEQMKYITYTNVIAKVIQLILLFLLVKSQQDYIFVLGSYGVANILSGLYSIRLAINKYRMNLRIASLADIWEQLRDGWYFFSSNLALTIANSATVLLLGFFVSNIEIGYYSVAEKIVFVAWTILGMFSQAIYPSVCRLAQGTYQQLRRFVWKTTLPLIGLTAAGCLFVYTFADGFVYFIVGHYEPKTAYILRFIIIVPFIVSLNIPAYQILLAYDYKKEYAAVFNGSAVINLILCTILVYVWGVIGAVSCMIVIQAIVTISLHVLLAIKRKKLVHV